MNGSETYVPDYSPASCSCSRSPRLSKPSQRSLHRPQTTRSPSDEGATPKKLVAAGARRGRDRLSPSRSASATAT